MIDGKRKTPQFNLIFVNFSSITPSLTRYFCWNIQIEYYISCGESCIRLLTPNHGQVRIILQKEARNTKWVGGDNLPVPSFILPWRHCKPHPNMHSGHILRWFHHWDPSVSPACQRIEREKCPTDVSGARRYMVWCLLCLSSILWKQQVDFLIRKEDFFTQKLVNLLSSLGGSIWIVLQEGIFPVKPNPTGYQTPLTWETYSFCKNVFLL